MEITTEGIKYAGSKLKLLPYLLQAARNLPEIHTVLDGFSGSTRVSQAFAQSGYTVTANDTAEWSFTLATCYLKADKPDGYYQKILDHLNALPPKDGWFSAHYGGEERDTKKPFRLKNTRKLDAIRPEIERLGLAEADKAVVLTSLLLALDRVDSTLGHFSSYLARWSARSAKDLFLTLPSRFAHGSGHTVLQKDIFDVLPRRSWDLAYFDPPYGSNNEKMPPSRVRYNAYYHFWKTVLKNDEPELFGAAGRRADSRDGKASSIFEEFRRDATGNFIALNALEKLIRQTRARYVMLSYSSGGRATKENLLNCLHRQGKLVQFLEIDYKKNIMADLRSTQAWARDGKNYEYIFVLQKK